MNPLVLEGVIECLLDISLQTCNIAVALTTWWVEKHTSNRGLDRTHGLGNVRVTSVSPCALTTASGPPRH